MADGHVAADFRAAGAGVDHVRVGERDFDCAHGCDGEEAVGDVVPGMTCVSGFPDASAGGAHVKGVGFRWHAGDGGDAASAEGADHAVAQAGPELGVKYDGVGGERESDEKDRGHAQKKVLFHGSSDFSRDMLAGHGPAPR